MPAPGWIRSPSWDLLWIQSGFWLAALHLVLLRSPARFEAYYAAAFLAFWMSHRMGTLFLSFGLPEYRRLAAAQPRSFVVDPLAQALFAFAFVFAPESWIPWDATRRLAALVVVRFWYDAYHFGSQHYGVLSLYRLRARQNPGSPFKGFEKAFCYSAALLSMVVPVLLGGRAVRLALGAAFAAGAIALAAAERAEERPSFPKLLYVLYLTGSVAAALRAESWLQVALVIALQHYVVATGLATRMIASAAPADSPSAWTRGLSRPWAPLALLFLLGLLPAALGWRSGQMAYFDRIFRGWLDNADRGPVFKLSAAIVFGLSYAHNSWDAAVFRFKDAAVRSVSLPLILGS